MYMGFDLVYCQPDQVKLKAEQTWECHKTSQILKKGGPNGPIDQ
jgi:hypothetical protein